MTETLVKSPGRCRTKLGALPGEMKKHSNQKWRIMNQPSTARVNRQPNSRPRGATSSNARSAANGQTVQASEQFQQYCEDLSNHYAIDGQSRILRWSPAMFVVTGVLLAYGLMYVDLRWFFFGPAFAVAGVAALAGTGAIRGKMLMRDRLWTWLKTWRVWEHALLVTVALAFLVASLVYDFWSVIFMGSVVGGVSAIVLVLTLLPSLRERQQSLLKPFDDLVSKIELQKISPLAIQAGLPSLMGPRWASLFEAKFGYQAYRSIVEQLRESQPELMNDRPVVRDWLLDMSKQSVHRKKGLLGTVAMCRSHFYDSLNARKMRGKSSQFQDESDLNHSAIQIVKRPHPELVTEDSDDLSREALGVDPREGFTSLVDGGEPAGSLSRPLAARTDQAINIASLGRREGNDADVGRDDLAGINAYLQADQINIGSINTHHHSSGMSQEEMLEFARLSQSIDIPQPRGHKKAAYDTMLQEAWSDKTRRRMRFPKLQKWLGEETRMGVGILLACVFASYLVQAGLFDEDTRGRLLKSFNQPELWSGSGVAACATHLTDTVSSLPSRLPVLGISGWAIGAASLICFGSGFLRDGWPYSFFVAVAIAIVVTLSTFSLDGRNPTTWLLIATALSMVVLIAGLVFDRKIPGWLEAQYQRKKTPT